MAWKDDHGRGIALEKSPTFRGIVFRREARFLKCFCSSTRSRRRFFAAAVLPLKKVLEVWRVPNIRRRMCVGEEEDPQTDEEYGALAKSKSRKTETEEMKRCIFRDSLEDMFDIAHSKAMEAKIPEEDKAFLEAQREDRQSCSMAGVDEKLKRATEKKRRKRQRMEEMKKKDAAASSSTLDRDVALE
ncbi:hypothetical protein GWK47_030175 [Chionoecetes opilio]|uniref:Uncharacterized protein n=1 Tax=Chionoecetes opilio TaxID=41210 RepID=A0A8J4YLR2_CHIOP|nr:hypothetical protein GWK47_030175 [Chionoecetes opilio]